MFNYGTSDFVVLCTFHDLICSQPEHEAIITAVCGDSCGVVWKITALTIDQQQN